VNSFRHAAPARVDLEVDYQPDHLRVAVPRRRGRNLSRDAGGRFVLVTGVLPVCASERSTSAHRSRRSPARRRDRSHTLDPGGCGVRTREAASPSVAYSHRANTLVFHSTPATDHR
jgi:hypothetical protein